MQTLVLHTSGDGALLRGVAQDLLGQRRWLRRQGIGLRFPGLASPRQQWDTLAAAMTGQDQETWLAAMRWRRRWPRDTWLCAKGFHGPVLREKPLNRWRDWLESQQLRLVVAVHLRSPRQQSWQRFVAHTLRLEGPVRGDDGLDSAWLDNDSYNTLIETAGVRGCRFLLHPQEPHSVGLADAGAALLEQPCWPSTAAAADLRAFALSLTVLHQHPQPLAEPQRHHLSRAVAVAARQLPPLNVAAAQELAAAAGWHPPDAPNLQQQLERFARRVWGTAWPESAAPASGNLGAYQRALAAAADQLFEAGTS